MTNEDVLNYVMKNHRKEMQKNETMSICVDRETGSVIILARDKAGEFTFFEVPEKEISFFMKCGDHCHNAGEMINDLLGALNNKDEFLH